VLNARYLESEGFGRAAATLDNLAEVARFIAAIPRLRGEEKLSRYAQDGNNAPFAAVNSLLDGGAAGRAAIEQAGR
jgi:hypothetical protein